MIDLHVHTTLGCGSMTPAEAVRYARICGYRAIALTDSVDISTMQPVLERLRPLARSYSLYAGIELFAGVELTHVPPPLIPDAVAEARKLGAQLVLVHGESVSDHVELGTNLAAIEAGVDILAHPGLITVEDATLAAERGVLLEVTTRPDHGLANGHVVAMARRTGATCVINNDARTRHHFVCSEMRRAVALGAGMTPQEKDAAESAARQCVQRLLTRP